MGLFSGESKEEKQQAKLEKLMAKFELSSLDSKYQNSVLNINRELAGGSLMEVGNLIAPDPKTANQIQIQYLNTLIQQNWIIIRMLDDLLKKDG